MMNNSPEQLKNLLTQGEGQRRRKMKKLVKKIRDGGYLPLEIQNSPFGAFLKIGFFASEDLCPAGVAINTIQAGSGYLLPNCSVEKAKNVLQRAEDEIRAEEAKKREQKYREDHRPHDMGGIK